MLPWKHSFTNEGDKDKKDQNMNFRKKNGSHKFDHVHNDIKYEWTEQSNQKANIFTPDKKTKIQLYAIYGRHHLESQIQLLCEMTEKYIACQHQPKKELDILY